MKKEIFRGNDLTKKKFWREPEKFFNPPEMIRFDGIMSSGCLAMGEGIPEIYFLIKKELQIKEEMVFDCKSLANLIACSDQNMICIQVSIIIVIQLV